MREASAILPATSVRAVTRAFATPSKGVQTHSPLIVAAQGTRLRLANNQILIERADGARTHVPIEQVGGLIAIGRGVDCTTPLLLALAERGRATVFLGFGGEPDGVLAPPVPARGLALATRAAQHAIESERARLGASAPTAARIAARIVREKCLAMESLLAQHDRSHDDVDLAGPRGAIAARRAQIDIAPDIDAIRGLEGAATAAYWQALPALFRGELATSRRTRRPPQDECNAALSFGYALAVGEISAMLALEGLEPALGVLHPLDHSQRPALALDLVEPWRHALVDRLVLRAANRGELRATHFERRDGGVLLNADGRRTFLSLYANAMQADAGDGSTVRARMAESVRAHAAALRELASSSVPPCAPIGCIATN